MTFPVGTATLLAGCCLVGPAEDAPEGMTRRIVLEQCMVSLSEEVTVPAQDAGLLVRLDVAEGDLTTREQLLGQIDDRAALAAQRVAEAAHFQAKTQAENDIDVRYAAAVGAVADADLAAAEESNRRAPHSVTASSLRRLQLEQQRAHLGIEQAEVRQQLTAYTVAAKEAEAEAAELAVERRRIESPLDGLVVEIFKRPGEWVQMGEAVLRLVRMDRVRVEGFLQVAEVGPQQVAQAPVTVQVQLENGRRETFEGQITFVNPRVHAGGQYRVRAEVINRREDDQFLLRPGHAVRMTIHLAQ